MNLAENLHYLRKRDKITQEELADKLGVSRQSVSKWETGEAYPETDKLILLCDLFGVSLDALLRTDLAADENEAPLHDAPSTPEPDPQVARAFISHMNGFSPKIALGVLLVFIGVSVCVLFGGLSYAFPDTSGDVASIIGAALLLVFIAAAVFLFITAGMNHDKFCKEHPKMWSVYSQDEINAFAKKFRIAIACLVSSILLDVVYFVVACALIDGKVIAVANQDSAICFCTAAFLLILGFIVFGLTYFGIQHSKYYIEEYNKERRKENNTKLGRIKEAVCATIMLTATAIFLLIGIIGNVWHPSWVCFPVGGILCAIVGAIIDGLNKD